MSNRSRCVRGFPTQPPIAQVGILVSIIVSCALCIRESAAVRIKILGRVPGTNYFEPLDDYEGDDGLVPGEEIPGVLIVRIRDVALTFGEQFRSEIGGYLIDQNSPPSEANAGALKERLRRLEIYGKGRHHPSEQPRRGEALSVLVFHFAGALLSTIDFLLKLDAYHSFPLHKTLSILMPLHCSFWEKLLRLTTDVKFWCVQVTTANQATFLTFELFSGLLESSPKRAEGEAGEGGGVVTFGRW